MNPDKFYKHVVKMILQKNEYEKVHFLMDKLFDEYCTGREEHFICKLGGQIRCQQSERVNG